MENKEPELKYENGYVVIRDVEVKLEEGICARPAAVIVKWSSRFPNKILLEKQNKSEYSIASGRSIMDLMILEVSKGSKLNLMVQDVPNTNPEDIARKLYAGLTTEDFYPYLADN